MHEHIKSKIFLKANALGSFFTQEGVVVLLSELSFLETRACSADIRRLGEGEEADCGRREERLAESLMLFGLGTENGDFRLLSSLLLPQNGI